MSPEQRILADVDKYGWHVIKIHEDAEGPSFAFTIGLTKTFSHPELILFGLSVEVMHTILNSAGTLIRGGIRFVAGVTTDRLLEGYACEFVGVPVVCYREYLGFARWFYGGDEFVALQCVWPDRRHRFPWQEGATPEFRRAQPVLGRS